ncbi:MAG: N-acetylmuramoyl-L-alanine amidase [Bacteroidales bacterium]|jgi:N-acetylmuramoyl-L-alanine amidase
MKRNFCFFSLLFTLVFIINIPVKAQNKYNKEYKIHTIVLDPGHGGKDPGAIGGGYKEKDIVLSICKKLGALIEKNYPDINVIYTRKTDVYVELHRRAAIANENNANLFISIHCNAARNKNAQGTETYVMGLSKTEANLEIAKKENAAILYEDNYQDHYSGYDPNSPESNIIFSLYQNAYMDQSITLAAKVQEEFAAHDHIDRSVKQAPFLVLWKASTTSILIETGFITNENDRKYLASEKGQNQIATDIFNAFSKYKYSVETKNNNVSAPIVIREEVTTEASTTVNNQKPNTSSNYGKNTSTSSSYSSDKPSAYTPDAGEIVYKVQFLTTFNKINTNSSKYKNLKDIDVYFQDGRYKYTTGVFKSEDEAKRYKSQIAKYGFSDAFVVKFRDGQRIN